MKWVSIVAKLVDPSYQTKQFVLHQKLKKKMSEVLFLRGFKASVGEAGLQTVRDAENAAVVT